MICYTRLLRVRIVGEVAPITGEVRVLGTVACVCFRPETRPTSGVVLERPIDAVAPSAHSLRIIGSELPTGVLEGALLTIKHYERG
jgi:hypothetical protein